MRMRRTLLLASAFTFVSSLFAQVNVQWESRYTSAGSNIDQASDMVIDAAGNVYVTGSSYNGVGTGFDLVTIKYNNAGVEQWVRTINGSANGYDIANAIDVDASGNVYVCGSVQTGSTDYDYVTAKYNSSGTLQWDRYYDQNGRFDEAKDVVVDGSGNVYVTGSFVASSTNTNFGTIKYNSAGTQQWAQPYNSAGNDMDAGLKIALDPIGGGVIVAGHSTSGSNGLDYAIIKYNTSGGVTWGPTLYDQNNDFDTPTDLVVDASGNVYVTGFSYYNALQDANYATVKLNSGGVQQWAMTYNGTASDYDKANALVVDGSGNVIVTGRSVGNTGAENYVTILYNSGGTEQWTKVYTSPGGNYDEATDVVLDTGGDIYVTGYSYLSGSNNDFVTIRYDAAGTQIWAVRFDGPAGNDDKALAMGVDPTGNIYVAGTSKGSGTNNDYSTIKYCQLLTDAGVDMEICTGDTVNLTVTGGATDVLWTPGATLSNPTGYTTQAYPTSTTEYVVYTDNVNGCRDYDTITVTVNPLPGPVITPSGPTTFCAGDSVTLVSDSYPSYQWSTGVNDTLQSVTVYSSGTITVTVVDTMGCNNTTAEVVTANALPPADAGLNDSICMGDSVQLLATGGVTYTWNYDVQLSDSTIADPWVVPTDTGWFYVTVTDASSCVNWDSVQVLVYPIPASPVISQVGYDLIASGGCTPTDYQWFLNGFPLGGANSVLYDATLSGDGDYFVQITDCNGCTNFSDTVSVTGISVDDISEFTNVNVYPNPNDGTFTIELFNTQSNNAMLRVIDIAGAVVAEEQLIGISGATRHTYSLDIAPGIYSVQVISDRGTVAQRIIIK